MDAYAAIEAKAPEELRALCRQRGIMRPGGPLLYAEADSRTTQEILWQAWRAAGREGAVPPFVAQIQRHVAQRLRGWYGLPQSAGVLDAAADALAVMAAPDGRALIEALLIYVGRLNLWLDAAIPWNELNRVFERA